MSYLTNTLWVIYNNPEYFSEKIFGSNMKISLDSKKKELTFSIYKAHFMLLPFLFPAVISSDPGKSLAYCVASGN